VKALCSQLAGYTKDRAKVVGSRMMKFTTMVARFLRGKATMGTACAARLCVHPGYIKTSLIMARPTRTRTRLERDVQGCSGRYRAWCNTYSSEIVRGLHGIQGN
jgi:hypothetical protein